MPGSQPSSLAGMLDVFDVQPSGGGHFTGYSDYGERQVVDASQVLSQSIVAATKAVSGKAVGGKRWAARWRGGPAASSAGR